MKRIFLTLCVFLGSVPVFAQTDTTAVAAPASKRERILTHLPDFFGFVQAGYRLSDDESTFYIKRARFGMQGNISPKFDFRMQVEFASKVQILDAYVQYHPKPYLRFRLGQYKIPFSIASTEYGPLRLELIEYAQVVRRLVAYSEQIGAVTHKVSGRDLGLTLYGGIGKRDGYYLFNYDLAVLNGAGINTLDHNRSKDLVARIQLKPVRGLTLSGSYYKGEFGADYLRRDRYAAGVCYDRDAVVVRGEWIGGRTGYLSEGGTSAGELKSDGWYAVLGWRATPKWMPIVQYDVFCANAAARSVTRQRNYTAGVLWMPCKHLRCQANYTRETYAAPDVTNRHVLNLLITGMF